MIIIKDISDLNRLQKLIMNHLLIINKQMETINMLNHKFLNHNGIMTPIIRQINNPQFLKSNMINNQGLLRINR